MSISKDSFLSGFLIFVALLVVDRLIPPSVDPVIAMTLSKNKAQINSINQKRDIEKTKEYMIDVVDLSLKNRFNHPVLGVLGWGENFFADINTTFTVSEKGLYRFEVGSDDGYELKVDGRKLCSFKKGRPFKTKICRARLIKGQHKLLLNYFQGYGNAGLTLKVSDGPKGELIFWGEDSDTISYLPPEK